MNPRNDSLRLRIRKGRLARTLRRDLGPTGEVREPEELFTGADCDGEDDESRELPALTEEDLHHS